MQRGPPRRQRGPLASNESPSRATRAPREQREPLACNECPSRATSAARVYRRPPRVYRGPPRVCHLTGIELTRQLSSTSPYPSKRTSEQGLRLASAHTRPASTRNLSASCLDDPLTPSRHSLNDKGAYRRSIIFGLGQSAIHFLKKHRRILRFAQVGKVPVEFVNCLIFHNDKLYDLIFKINVDNKLTEVYYGSLSVCLSFVPPSRRPPSGNSSSTIPA